MGKLIIPTKWSPNLAYIVGLLTTDGNLSKDGRHLTMRSSDVDLLKTFKACLNIENKIAQSVNDGYDTKPCYRVQFSNVRLYRWLLEIGLSPAKSRTLGKIKIPDQYFRDFLRGHLDGDGSIFTYIDKYNYYKGHNYINNRIYTKFVSASPLHIQWLHKTISQLTGFKSALFSRKPRKINYARMWEIKFSKHESVRLLSWIYYKPDLPCLERKKSIAIKALDLVANEKRKAY